MRYEVHLMTSVIVRKVVTDDVTFIDLRTSLVIYEPTQKVEFMFFREPDNLFDLFRSNKLLMDHEPMYDPTDDPMYDPTYNPIYDTRFYSIYDLTFDPTYDLTTNKLPYRVLNFHYLLFDVC